jgi:adenylate cyclase
VDPASNLSSGRLGPSAYSSRWERLPGPIQGLADLGSSPSDGEELRLQRRVLNLTTVLIAGLTPIWTVTYLALGLELSALIPLIFAVVTVIFITAHARTGSYRTFRFGVLLMMLVFPFVLQWSLGGFAGGSTVALWALTAPLGAMFFAGPRYALPWFAAFAALVVISVIFDPGGGGSSPEIPATVRLVFFGLNLLAVSTTVFLMLQYFVRTRELAQARSERLLLNVLPAPIADRLKRSEDVIADAYPGATVLFADLVGFTPLAESISPERLVLLLDEIFSRWDGLADAHELEKIKTIGDSYMAVGGVPTPRADHAPAVASMALGMVPELALCGAGGVELQARIGIATGPVVAGVIGRSKFSFDLWGDTVNTASRMESTGEPGRIHVTGRLREELSGQFAFEPRGELAVKGKGMMRTYFLERVESGF